MTEDQVNEFEQLILTNFEKKVISYADLHLYQELIKEVRQLRNTLNELHTKINIAHSELDNSILVIEEELNGFFDNK
jgi:hypothetical protein